MGLYKRLLEERAAEEQRRGGRLTGMRGLDSKVLVRRLENAPRRGSGSSATDLSMVHWLITRGPSNAWEGIRVENLKAKYRQGKDDLVTTTAASSA